MIDTIPKGNTIANRDLCWNLAKQNVPGAAGIWWYFGIGQCRAIDNIAALGTWQSTYPDSQGVVSLCIINPTPGIQSRELQSGSSTHLNAKKKRKMIGVYMCTLFHV